jgi:hypothetical protein
MHACIAGPLTYLLNKNYCVWKEEDALSISILQDAMSSTPVLKTTFFGKTFTVYYDASGQGIGAILT